MQHKEGGLTIREISTNRFSEWIWKIPLNNSNEGNVFFFKKQYMDHSYDAACWEYSKHKIQTKLFSTLTPSTVIVC